MDKMISRLFKVEPVWDLYQPEALLYLLLLIALMWIAGRIYNARVPYDLVEELAHADNPAVGISYAGFVFGLGLALYGVLTADGLPNLVRDLLDMALLGLLSVVLLGVGQAVNDRVAFPNVNLVQAVKDGNIAAGMAKFGSFVSTGLIVMRAIALDGESEIVRAVNTVVFFVAAQIAFLLFVVFYEKITKYDVKEQVKADNPAAGIAIALSMVAIALVLSYAITQTGSLVVFAAWFVLASVLLLIVRLVLDKAILPGHALDDEISRDKNWGVALLEGSLAVVVALVVTGAF
jgi:uncharacterized membrane protein YjfL (UPF0719 family)